MTQKKFSWFTALFFLLISGNYCRAEQVFDWKEVLSPGKITISAKIAPNHYLYHDKTTVTVKDRTGKRLKASEVPKPVMHKDEMFGDSLVLNGRATPYTWIFPTKGVQGPFKVELKYQGCRGQTGPDSAPVCFMPESKTITLSDNTTKSTPATDTTANKPGKINIAATTQKSPPTTSGKPVLLPQTLQQMLDNFSVIASASGEMSPDEFINFLEMKKAKSSHSVFADKSVLLIIISIIIGGILLNLTPCVLPMIPINLAIIGAGIKAESKFSGFIRGGTYGAGMAIAYGALGLIVVFSGAKFGTLNSHYLFNFIIAVIFIILSLAMFDLIHIDLSRFGANLGPSEKSRGSLIMVFVLGVIAALLAGACVAPVVIAVLLHSASLYAQHNYAGLILPFLLGFGMALPWPFAGAGLSFLPKPGGWMTKIKMFFGVIILLFALYYGHKGYLLLPRPSKLDVAGNSITTLETGLRQSLKTDKPVIIDFWATWCTTCKKMNATTFKDASVKKILEQKFIFIKFQAEDLDDRETKAILDYFKVMGLPTYVILQKTQVKF